MSRHSTPTSGLAKLALRDREREMPVTTRARSAQVKESRGGQATAGSSRMQSGQQQPSQSSSSRPIVGPSRTGTARQQAPASSPPGDSSSDDSSEDPDSDDNEGQAATGPGQGQQGGVQNQNILASIYAALSALNDDGLSPRGFATPSNQANLSQQTQLARNLALAFTTLVRTNDDLVTFQALTRVPGPAWSMTLARNLSRRFRDIAEGLQASAAGNGGQDVLRTVEALRRLFFAIGDVRNDHFGQGMDAASREIFTNLMLTILEYIIHHNEDLYLRTNRPAYAGEATRNERRLFACWLAQQSNPGQFMNIVYGCRGHLASQRPRFGALARTVQGYLDNGIAGLSNDGNLEWLRGRLDALARDPNL